MSDMNVAEFRQVVRSQGFRAVGIHGVGTEFFITAMMKSGEAMCLEATRRKLPRRFRSPDPALALLYSLGVRRVEVDMSRWEPERERLYAPHRPDAAARMRRAHQAAGLVSDPP